MAKKPAPVEANERGEVALPLAGQRYQIRPSREAIMNIERQLGRSLYDLADAARGHNLALEEMGVIAAEMMQAYGRTHPDDELITDYRGAKPDRLADMIFEAGPMLIQPRLLVGLLAALTGGVTSSGEAKAATENR